MKAIFELKGKQFSAEKGDVLEVPFLSEDGEIEVKNVLMLKDNDNVIVGKPFVENARVILEKIEDKKSRKIIVFKFKRRKNYKRTYGHRQKYSVVKVKDIIA